MLVIHTLVSFNTIRLFLNYYLTEVSHTERFLLIWGLEKGEHCAEWRGAAWESTEEHPGSSMAGGPFVY